MAEFVAKDRDRMQAVVGGAWVENFIASEQFGIVEELSLRDSNEDVEMIVEDRVGEDLHAAELGELP
jgi:hypothetical protein